MTTRKEFQNPTFHALSTSFRSLSILLSVVEILPQKVGRSTSGLLVKVGFRPWAKGHGGSPDGSQPAVSLVSRAIRLDGINHLDDDKR